MYYINDFEFAKIVVRLNLIVNFIENNKIHIVKLRKKNYEKKIYKTKKKNEKI